MPQGHLKDEIDIYRQPIKEMNTKILEELLSRIPMRVSLDYHEVARIFIQILHFVELQYVTEKGGMPGIHSGRDGFKVADGHFSGDSGGKDCFKAENACSFGFFGCWNDV